LLQLCQSWWSFANFIRDFGTAFFILNKIDMPFCFLNFYPRFQVASIQTLTRRDKPEADLIIIDECHLSVSASFLKILEHYTPLQRLSG
jgi:type I site-specific restriction endonuclease